MHEDKSLRVIKSHDTFIPFFSLLPSPSHKQDSHWTFFAELPDGHHCFLLQSG